MSTCLIIGAGASYDICKEFRLGSQLIDELLTITSVGQTFHINCMHQLNISKINIDSFHRNLQEYAMSNPSASVDEFLTEVEMYPEYRTKKDNFITIGKLGIITCILEWESKFLNQCTNINLDDSWLAKVVPFMKDRNKPVDGNSLFIISFNYDRLVEHILENHFGLRRQLFENIIHVYGKLPDDLTFGKNDYTLNELLPFKDHIETIYHKRFAKNNYELKRAIAHIKYVIYFMGFGYDYFNLQNIQLLNYVTFDSHKKSVYANIYIKENFPYNKRRAETKRIRSIINYPNFSYLKCNQFIDFMLSQK